MDRFINVDMTNQIWQGEPEGQRLLASLLTMGRYEADYRLLRKEYLGQLFAGEFSKFGKIAENIAMPAKLKEQMTADVKSYADSLRDWGEAVDDI